MPSRTALSRVLAAQSNTLSTKQFPDRKGRRTTSAGRHPEPPKDAKGLPGGGHLEAPAKANGHVREGNTLVFVAPQRWGKTLSAVIRAHAAWRTGRIIHSNIWLDFPHERLHFREVGLDKGSRFRNGHVLIDELNFFFDGRRSMSGKNLRFSTWLLQQKKQGCNLTGTTHGLESLDVRFRDHYDYAIYPSVYPPFPERPVVLRMEIENGPTTQRLHKTVKMDCRPFLGMYDTYAIYDPFEEDGDA